METIDCLICLSRAENPCMCVKCSKVFCDACLQTHFQMNTTHCPHCRASVGQEANGFVNVQRLLVAAERSSNAPVADAAVADACRSHPFKQLSLYCSDCKASCCLDCTKTDHCNHRLMALEVANEDVRNRYESLSDKIETVNQLARDYNIHVAKIALLKEEGERRIADLQRRLQEEVNYLKTRLQTKRHYARVSATTSNSLPRSSRPSSPN